MSTQTIFPSAGHNSFQSGAIAADGRTEAELTIEFQKLLVKNLDDFRLNYILDKPSESNTEYQTRIKTGDGSVLLDIHFNWAEDASIKGTEAYVKYGATQNSRSMGYDLVNITSEILNTPNRGLKTEDKSQHSRIGILHKKGTCVLIEIEFISNPDALKNYDEKKIKLAHEYAKILHKYEGLL